MCWQIMLDLHRQKKPPPTTNTFKTGQKKRCTSEARTPCLGLLSFLFFPPLIWWRRAVVPCFVNSAITRKHHSHTEAWKMQPPKEPWTRFRPWFQNKQTNKQIQLSKNKSTNLKKKIRLRQQLVRNQHWMSGAYRKWGKERCGAGSEAACLSK